MGTTYFINEIQFSPYYLSLYKKGESSLGKLSTLFMRDLTMANKDLTQDVRSKAILRTKFICQVAIHAEELYYENNIFLLERH